MLPWLRTYLTHMRLSKSTALCRNHSLNQLESILDDPMYLLELLKDLLGSLEAQDYDQMPVAIVNNRLSAPKGPTSPTARPPRLWRLIASAATHTPRPFTTLHGGQQANDPAAPFSAYAHRSFSTA